MPTFNLATVRVGRHGGATGADQLFRARLYEQIGAVTAAGGHVETVMKRLVLLLCRDEGGFSAVDLTWTRLHQALASEATGLDPDARRKRLGRVLA